MELIYKRKIKPLHVSKAHLKCALIAMNHRGPANGNASEEDALGVMGVGVVAERAGLERRGQFDLH